MEMVYILSVWGGSSLLKWRWCTFCLCVEANFSLNGDDAHFNCVERVVFPWMEMMHILTVWSRLTGDNAHFGCLTVCTGISLHNEDYVVGVWYPWLFYIMGFTASLNRNINHLGTIKMVRWCPVWYFPHACA